MALMRRSVVQELSRAWNRGSFQTLFPRLYHKNVIDHYENPRNVGSFDKSDPNVGTGSLSNHLNFKLPCNTGLVGAPACGDVLKLQIKVDSDGNIVDSCFKTFGCASAIASSSVASEWVKGRTLDKAGGTLFSI